MFQYIIKSIAKFFGYKELLFECELCGRKFDNSLSMRVCEDWDRILKQSKDVPAFNKYESSTKLPHECD